MNSHDQDVISADGTRLVVRRAGSGDPVVLLHGSGGGLHSWDPVIPLLVDDYELWMPARRGYGPSDIPTGSKSFADDVADVLAVIEAAGRPVHLVGASTGATVALHTALAHPDSVRSLAVFEAPLFSAGLRIVPLLDRYRAALHNGDARMMGEVLTKVTQLPAPLAAKAAEMPQPEPEEGRRVAVGWLHDLEAMARETTDVSRWSAVTVRTLLMQGADTWEPMPTTMNKLAATIPGARQVIWPGQSHFATMTAPDLFAGALRGFFPRPRWRRSEPIGSR